MQAIDEIIYEENRKNRRNALISQLYRLDAEAAVLRKYNFRWVMTESAKKHYDAVNAKINGGVE